MNKPFIVAELSANHLGNLQRAINLVDTVAGCGADAVKLQTWTPDTMVLQRGHLWKGQDLMDLYREAWLPWDFHRPIFDRCKKLGIECFSAPFDKASVDFLETLGCPRYKIASFELVDLDLIAYVARLGKPMVLSTGMATENEIDDAYWETANCPATFLLCTSSYPALAADANIRKMRSIAAINGCDVGISDHTEGIGVAVAATALGASYIEKHLTLSRADGGPDSSFSMEPAEFKQMVTECRRAAAALGEVKFGPIKGDCTSLRRSLHFSRPLPAGCVIMREDMCTARPADGLSPNLINDAIGYKLLFPVAAGDPVKIDIL